MSSPFKHCIPFTNVNYTSADFGPAIWCENYSDNTQLQNVAAVNSVAASTYYTALPPAIVSDGTCTSTAFFNYPCDIDCTSCDGDVCTVDDNLLTCICSCTGKEDFFCPFSLPESPSPTPSQIESSSETDNNETATKQKNNLWWYLTIFVATMAVVVVAVVPIYLAVRRRQAKRLNNSLERGAEEVEDDGLL